MSGREKFAWFEAMCADDKMTPGQRLIIGYCGIKYAKAEQHYLVTVNQQTVANHLGTRRAAVSEAFQAAYHRGWMCKLERAPGGRGHHGGDTWQLTMPDETCTENSTGFDETCTENDQNLYGNPHKPVRKSDETCTAANASTSDDDVPYKGFKQGIEEGFLKQGMAAAAPAAGGGGHSERYEIDGARLDQTAPPLMDHERCKRHEVPDPECVVCRAFAHARRESLEREP